MDLPENAGAKNFLEQFFAQKNFSNSQFSSCIIKGQSYSGKTYLLKIFAKKYPLIFLDSAKIIEAKENHFYVFEDANRALDEDLLHLINEAIENKAFLILTTRDDLKFKLKDLNSRLKNIYKIEIKNPEADSIRMLLINEFANRQLKVADKIVDFIANNIERDFAKVFALVEMIDDFCCKSGKGVAIADIRKMMEDCGEDGLLR